MDKLSLLKIDQTSTNYYNLKNNRKNLKLKINNILCPFGIDDQYGQSVLKIEIDQTNENHINIISELRDLENKLKEQFSCNENEWKSLINLRDNNNIFLECKIKKMKNNLITKLSFENKESNYLKTIYELDKNFYCNVVLEIPTLWDFRKNNEENLNKIGLILNVLNIHIL